MTKSVSRFLAAGLVLLALVSLTACAAQPAEAPQEPAPAEQPAAETPAAPETPAPTVDPATVTELKVEEIKAGDGAEAKSGDTVSVHYTGWLADGTKFESSLDSGQPIQFALGQGQVIPGWDQGVTGMKVGEKRRLIIPPDMAYGESGSGPIPPNSVLIFDVELVSIP